MTTCSHKIIMSLHAKQRKSSIAEQLADHVASRSKRAIIATLNTIKNDSKVMEDFSKNKGLDILAKLLKYQNFRVLDCTLSILADAFLKSSIREEVRDSAIAVNTVWIIKNLTAGVTLHCRACRLIGNMAESKRHAKTLCNAGVLIALDGIIDNTKTNTQTLMMAIRAIRNIWMINEQSHVKIIELEMIKKISEFLVTYRSKYQGDTSVTKYRDSSETCIKALRAFAESSKPIIGQQIAGKDLRGFKCISEMSKSNNRISFQLLYKLCLVANHRPSLGCVGTIECLVNYLENKDELSNTSAASFFPDVVGCICLFSREAVNRLKIRNLGGLQLMLNLLNDPKNDAYHPILLHALTQFTGEETHILIMIKNGIVNVLVDRLKRMELDVRLKMSSESKKNLSTRKRAADTPMSPENNSVEAAEIKYNRTDKGRFSLDFYSNRFSPCSIISSSSSSPTNSPPLTYYAPDDASDDKNYSPVCSDIEDCPENDHESAATQEEVDSLKSYASTNFGKDEGSNSAADLRRNLEMDLPINSSDVNLAHMWTLILLTRLTFWNGPIEGLADSSTIQALMAYIITSKNFGASYILNRIIKNHVYFLPLLLQGFVFDAQLLDNAQDYLQDLRGVAESGGAFGDMATILIRGRHSDKFIVAVSVPFLLISKEKLRLLLGNYGGLELIFRLLADQKHLLNKNAILSICQLAEVLGVIPESIEKSPLFSDQASQGPVINQVDQIKSKNVIFELDNGDTVKVSRHLLCIKSHVFSAMLEGKFFEGGKKKIRLKNVSKDGFRTLCLAASGSLLNDARGNNDDDDDDDIKIEALLDAVLLADKYLMADECSQLTKVSMSRLSHGNLTRAWNWARSNDCSELKIYCVKNFLTLKLSREDRLKTFRDFYVDQNFDEFLQDIERVVKIALLIRG